MQLCGTDGDKIIMWRHDHKLTLYWTGVLIGSLLVLTGCQPHGDKPFDWHDLCRLKGDPPVVLGVANEAEVLVWIVRTSGQKPETSVQSEGPDTTVWYWWKERGTDWTVLLLNGRLALVSISGVKEKLTFEQVVATLGPPQFVHAELGWLTCERDCPYFVHLDYPQLGVSVTTQEVKPSRTLLQQGKGYAVKLSPQMQVSWIDCYVPQPMEDVLRQAFRISPENVVVLMQLRQPWPGFDAWIPLGP